MLVHLWFIISLILSNIVKIVGCPPVISVIIVLFSPCNCVAAHLLHKRSIRSTLKEVCVSAQLLLLFLIKLQFSSELSLSFPAKILQQTFLLQVSWKMDICRELNVFYYNIIDNNSTLLALWKKNLMMLAVFSCWDPGSEIGNFQVK